MALSSVSWMSCLCLPREQICSLFLRNHPPWIIYSMVCASLSLYLKQAHDSMISTPTWYIASNKDMIYLSEPSNTQNTSRIGVFFFEKLVWFFKKSTDFQKLNLTIQLLTVLFQTEKRSAKYHNNLYNFLGYAKFFFLTRFSEEHDYKLLSSSPMFQNVMKSTIWIIFYNYLRNLNILPSCP